MHEIIEKYPNVEISAFPSATKNPLTLIDFGAADLTLRILSTASHTGKEMSAGQEQAVAILFQTHCTGVRICLLDDFGRTFDTSKSVSCAQAEYCVVNKHMDLRLLGFRGQTKPRPKSATIYPFVVFRSSRYSLPFYSVIVAWFEERCWSSGKDIEFVNFRPIVTFRFLKTLNS